MTFGRPSFWALGLLLRVWKFRPQLFLQLCDPLSVQWCGSLGAKRGYFVRDLQNATTFALTVESVSWRVSHAGIPPRSTICAADDVEYCTPHADREPLGVALPSAISSSLSRSISS